MLHPHSDASESVPLLHLCVSLNFSCCCQYVRKTQLLKQRASTAINFLCNLNTPVLVFIFCYIGGLWYLLEKLRPLRIVTVTKTSVFDWVKNRYKWRKLSWNFEFIAAALTVILPFFTFVCVLVEYCCTLLFLYMQYKTPQFPYWNLKVWNTMWNQICRIKSHKN